MPDELMTLKQCADELKYNHQTALRYHIQKKHLSATKVGRDYVVTRKEFEKFKKWLENDSPAAKGEGKKRGTKRKKSQH